MKELHHPQGLLKTSTDVFRVLKGLCSLLKKQRSGAASEDTTELSLLDKARWMWRGHRRQGKQETGHRGSKAYRMLVAVAGPEQSGVSAVDR